MKASTFADLYEAKKKEPTPLRSFLQEMADITGCDWKTVQQWARGYVRPGNDSIAKLSQHLGIDASGLFPQYVPSINTDTDYDQHRT